jgi:hypothetical protein
MYQIHAQHSWSNTEEKQGDKQYQSLWVEGGRSLNEMCADCRRNFSHLSPIERPHTGSFISESWERGRELTARITQMLWHKNKTSSPRRKEPASHSTHRTRDERTCFQYEAHILMKYNFHFYLKKSYNIRVKAKCCVCVGGMGGGSCERKENVPRDGRGTESGRNEGRFRNPAQLVH